MTTLQERKEKFETYHEKNPHIYGFFKKFALEAIARGRKKLSISLITERIRWEVMTTTESDDGFKISNNHRAFYARKFHEDFPQFGNIFTMRAQRA